MGTTLQRPPTDDHSEDCQLLLLLLLLLLLPLALETFLTVQAEYER
jgi:hypothetical protein